jgi:hypothetical protein
VQDVGVKEGGKKGGKQNETGMDFVFQGQYGGFLLNGKYTLIQKTKSTMLRA